MGECYKYWQSKSMVPVVWPPPIETLVGGEPGVYIPFVYCISSLALHHMLCHMYKYIS